jgi:hypothetical protein
MVEEMTASEDRIGQEAQGCPMHAMHAQRRVLHPDDELVFPLHKRAVTQYAADEDGLKELRLYYGDKEISFEEALFSFGENLAKQARFIAGTATAWGEGYDWPRVQELLEQLLEEGILQHADRDVVDGVTASDGARPSPLPPALTTEPCTWFESASITQTLTGRPLELGYLEMVIPIFRVAHIALDAEGRQVGEANVFPKALRLDVPTSWRTCIYPGTRFQADRPMNVTALKSMRAHWSQMMQALLIIRHAYLERFPAARQGWTVGHLERLATLVLAVPTYLLMRSERRIGNGELHPALSSLFRVTDGLRMTMHQMLFVPIGEPTLSPDAPMTSEEIFAYAERNYSFYSDHGVCAGPKVMIEEFLGTLVDGRTPKDAATVVLDAPVQEAIDVLDAALDYGLHGLRVHAVTFSLWPEMARTYERLAAIADAWAVQGQPQVVALRDRLRGRIDNMKTATYLATEEWRVNREQVYADMYAQCGAALSEPRPAAALPEAIAAHRATQDADIERRLRTILLRRLTDGDESTTAHLENMVSCLANYFLQVQAIVRVACNAQNDLNALLGRSPPASLFNAAQIDIHNLLQGKEGRKLPYLDDELEEAIGMRILIDQERIQITDSITDGAAQAGH